MRSELRTGLIIAVTVALLAYFLRSANLSAVWIELRRAELGHRGVPAAEPSWRPPWYASVVSSKAGDPQF